MQTTKTPGAAPPRRYRRRDCCLDAACDAGLRNRYFEGKRLTANSFRVEQDYTLERRRLVHRAIHGWGVVYGYAVREAAGSDGLLQIGPGLALDECGRELLQARTALAAVGDAVLFDDKGARIDVPPPGSYAPRTAAGSTRDEPPRACWLLSVHYAEQLVGPVRIGDPCGGERDEWDQVCETVRFSLRRIDCAACGREQGRTPEDRAGRGDRRGLCEHLTGLGDVACEGLERLDDPCVQVRADLRHGLALACVTLRAGQCEGEWLFEHVVDACGPRRLVKSNDVLFDLLPGGDLTRISAICWADWHRSSRLVEWDAFDASFGMPGGDELERLDRGRDRRETFPVVTVGWWVEFSRPVRAGTVRADCFSMTVLKAADEGGWTTAYRVPILRADTWAPPGTQAGLASRAVLVVDGRWLDQAVRGSETIFDKDPVTVEIEVRGDLIVDGSGQAVDANAHGLLPAPTGNNSPGGTFFSSFRVQPRLAGHRIADDRADRMEGVES